MENPTLRPILLSYDLGLRGDYNGLYILLDKMEAVEAGTNTAIFVHKVLPVKHDVLFDELKKLLSENVKLEPNDRVYALIADENGFRGKFLFGGRKRAPWEGFAVKSSGNEEVF